MSTVGALTGVGQMVMAGINAADTVDYEENTAQPAIRSAEQVNLKQVDTAQKVSELQEAMQLATARRTARKRVAAVAAKTLGAGVSGSVLDVPVTDVNTSLINLEDYTASMRDIQNQQYDLQRQDISARADIAIAESENKISRAIGNSVSTGFEGASRAATSAYSLYENWGKSGSGTTYDDKSINELIKSANAAKLAFD